MRFGLQITSQNSLAGWLAPDNPTRIPKFKIETENGIYILEAHCHRLDIQQAGFHETGLVGFDFSEHNVPGITTAQEITLTELTHNKVIFRKTKGSVVDGRLFIFNNLPVPSQKFKRGIGEQFLCSYLTVEELGVETVIELLDNALLDSVFAEGRLAINAHVNLLKSLDYHISGLIVDPFTELANRLLILKVLIENGKENIANRLSPYFSELIEAMKRINSLPENIDLFLSQLTPPEKNVIANPLVRALGCSPGEEPEARHVAIALETLARFDTVGIATRLDDYREMVHAIFPRLIIPSNIFQELDRAADVETALRSSSKANKMLTHDVRLYRYICQSLDQVLKERES